MQKALNYIEWRKFEKVINKAIVSCINSNARIHDHFCRVDKTVKTGDSVRKINDYKLSIYACYLIVQNGDSPPEKMIKDFIKEMELENGIMF